MGVRHHGIVEYPLDPERLSPRERRWLSGRWTRRLLLIAAVVIVVGSVPPYIEGVGSSAESHAVRHLAAWQIGFGVGLFVAAWMSRMSHALLALAATFAGLTIVAKMIDVVSGHPGPWLDPVHLVELIGVVLLWLVTPAHLLPRWSARASKDTPARGDLVTPLRVVEDDPGPIGGALAQ